MTPLQRWQQGPKGTPHLAKGLRVTVHGRHVAVAADTMVDSGSQWLIMGQHLAEAGALTIRPLATQAKMVLANGTVVEEVVGVTDVTLTIAGGTDNEASTTLDAVVVPGLEGLADIILPMTAMHAWGAGLDSFTERFTYRPRLAQGDPAQVSVPVVYRGGGAGAQPAAMFTVAPVSSSSDGEQAPAQQQQQPAPQLEPPAEAVQQQQPPASWGAAWERRQRRRRQSPPQQQRQQAGPATPQLAWLQGVSLPVPREELAQGQAALSRYQQGLAQEPPDGVAQQWGAGAKLRLPTAWVEVLLPGAVVYQLQGPVLGCTLSMWCMRWKPGGADGALWAACLALSDPGTAWVKETAMGAWAPEVQQWVAMVGGIWQGRAPSEVASCGDLVLPLDGRHASSSSSSSEGEPNLGGANPAPSWPGVLAWALQVERVLLGEAGPGNGPSLVTLAALPLQQRQALERLLCMARALLYLLRYVDGRGDQLDEWSQRRRVWLGFHRERLLHSISGWVHVHAHQQRSRLGGGGQPAQGAPGLFGGSGSGSPVVVAAPVRVPSPTAAAAAAAGGDQGRRRRVQGGRGRTGRSGAFSNMLLLIVLLLVGVACGLPQVAAAGRGRGQSRAGRGPSDFRS
jgi:hypothetical protein